MEEEQISEQVAEGLVIIALTNPNKEGNTFNGCDGEKTGVKNGGATDKIPPNDIIFIRSV
ncbi:hypothetical protein AB6L78_002812 [Listeria monocytogenes]|nr:hypothetical protein [Listeria monocytogenes]EHM3340650.1 hypothetical protein [Listeria monocytogenes]EHM3395694.1 hypothetical protein [Listeria monocytogenes]EKJ1381272.1 hypothetical protein [Listeria monocytogenes]